MTIPAEFLTRAVFAAYAEHPPEIVYATATTLVAVHAFDDEDAATTLEQPRSTTPEAGVALLSVRSAADLFRPWDAIPLRRRRSGSRRRRPVRRGGGVRSLRVFMRRARRRQWSVAEVGLVLVSVHSILLWSTVLVAG